MSKGLDSALAKTKPKAKGLPCSPPRDLRHAVTLCMCFFCGFGAGWCCRASQLPELFFWGFQLCPCHEDYYLGLCWNNPSNPTNYWNPHLLCLCRNSRGWRRCHLEGAEHCFGHMFGQFLAGILPTVNFFGGSRVSGFFLVFLSFCGIVTATFFRL